MILLIMLTNESFLRLFGYSHIDHLIHFEGYNQSWVIRFANAPKDTVRNKIIFQHNDKLSEWRKISIS